MVGLLVMSHWWLDVLAHRPDLPLYPGGEYVAGLNLWSSLWGTVVLELLMFAAGVALYLRATAGRGQPRRALWGLLLFLVMVYLANLFGSPPPSTRALAWVGEAQWLLVLWGYWADRAGSKTMQVTSEGQVTRRNSE